MEGHRVSAGDVPMKELVDGELWCYWRNIGGCGNDHCVLLFVFTKFWREELGRSDEKKCVQY